jgi:hypothetical protein
LLINITFEERTQAKRLTKKYPPHPYSSDATIRVETKVYTSSEGSRTCPAKTTAPDVSSTMKKANG